MYTMVPASAPALQVAHVATLLRLSSCAMPGQFETAAAVLVAQAAGAAAAGDCSAVVQCCVRLAQLQKPSGVAAVADAVPADLLDVHTAGPDAEMSYSWLSVGDAAGAQRV